MNDAGQIHAHICYLRDLPYAEQLYWLSFNTEPLAAISKRAFINDFKSDFVDFSHPRDELISIVSRWKERGIDWWKICNAELLNRANIPLVPTLTDIQPCAHWRSPMDMMRHG